MKKAKKSTVILIMSLLLTSMLTGCSGCGTGTDKSKNDMVESTPVHSEENLFDENTDDTGIGEHANDEGKNATANDITGEPHDENGTIVDSEGNIVDDAGNIIRDAGDVVGNVVENVGNAAEDVTNGIGEGVKDMTR